MSNKAFFKVDTKLAELLGETYRSTEYALKELVDNAYDADSEKLTISFPKELTPNPEIIISDNGSGMKENEVRTEYLNVANSRIVRKGELSIKKKRKVKGRKGIGKFSGLMVATKMKLETVSTGVKTTLVIDRDELAIKGYDLEKIPLDIRTEKVKDGISGTTITLTGLNQNFEFPNPERMKQILVWDYGRENDFEISINDERIGVLDLQGKSYSEELIIDGKKAILNYTITSKPIKSSGIVTKVGNKLIGRPKNFLAEDDIIPKKLQNRIYGEIICDDLENDVTADWGAIIENSKLNKAITEKTTEKLKKSVDDVFKTDMKMARARYQRKINKELEKLPEYKQPFARKALHKTLEKFYGESESKINTVISVMVSAMEKDHYWDIISNIQNTGNSDIEKFASALNDFGLLEMSIVTSQALNRLKYLDELLILIEDKKALEKDIHKALELNTWILGDDYNVLISDTSLETAVNKVLNKTYRGDKAQNRPDLLLGRTLSRELVLIEFKRPDFTINRDTERQALEYRDELNTYFHNQHIRIILLGGRVKQNISSHNERDDVHFRTYLDIISVARTKLEWLIDELKK
ncbi:ATP-binding protein [Tenacibaculum maritimum]|uniref:ATP-binding protein n=1 Tax=Tenacibaculum maritimum TaxID=107401 RepID=UPI001E5F8FD6|nr:ATP-binding protein [Tenacibaculum maritimum]MCD9586156.1 ATP-binding protein [Tenacibaculum maritimum]MCD9622207.1 ATP-binding protein [Tenacibaculum maritimum]MCD9628632.1 ATP-binding protein [Tenacibaculum maritimum]MCD9631527.1 ATP-binding protein [Tenacibaculum maritimum]MCD9634275.1 ATP-binding protein [Tenacibaculum maritimum]